MLTKDVVEFFGSQEATAKALGIKQPSVATWSDIVPPLRQIQIERITKGRFKADADVFANRRQRPAANEPPQSTHEKKSA